MIRILLCIVLIVSCANPIFAGIEKLKHVEKDGFTWYEVCKNKGSEECGVMDVNGKMIIPMKYDDIEYDEEDKVFYCCIKDSSSEAMWTTDGKCIISEDRNFEDLCYDTDGKGNTWISISDDKGNDGVCDLDGNLIIEPKYWAIYYEEPQGFYYYNKDDAEQHFFGLTLSNYKRKSFKIFATDYITERIKAWQAKGEFESTSEWKKRVNADTQSALINKLLDEVSAIFVMQNMPKEKIQKAHIGKYDADRGVFPVGISGRRDMYVSVPVNEAPEFKAKWSKVDIQPVYGIVGDTVGIVRCTFKLGKKEYQLADNDVKEVSSSDLALSLPEIKINVDDIANNTSKPQQKPSAAKPIPSSKVDSNIPENATDNAKTFAVIVGNENYQSVEPVPYALNDANVFAKYCNKTLGIPQKNIKVYRDASYGKMLSALKRVADIAEAYDGDVNIIFYYAGHGVPNEASKSAYLLPIDADGSQTEVCYSIDRLYEDLQDTDAKSIVVFLDACFSGANRGNGMISAARGVAIKPHEAEPEGNMVVFTAASGSQTAYPYEDKGHGMFTYFLLEKLQSSKGNATLKEIADYISTNVRRQSVVINEKVQTPTVTPSGEMPNWTSLKLR